MESSAKYASPTKPLGLRRAKMWAGKLSVGLALLVTVWAIAALYYDVRILWLSIALATVYSIAVAIILWRFTASGKALLLWVVSLVCVIGWWLTLTPSNDRQWQPDVARLPWAEVAGDHVILHNVRNFAYQTETDYTEHWETRSLNLSELAGVDVFVTHWGAPLIAHVIVSFEFQNSPGPATYVAMSIEARKTVGQDYSAIGGLFRQYELIYLAADERDVVRLRTNYRMGETVRIYHTRLNPDDSRRLFLQYLQWIEQQRNHPQWYNAATANCSSSLTSYLSSHNIGGVHWWDPRIILNGMAEKLLYQRGDLATGGLTFEALEQRAVINEKARGLDQDANFSLQIRDGQPGF
ncbi:MAG: DUF4105 domain-containing protein [Acidobacteriota bacterium]